MSELDEIMEENMVCATVHAQHAATTTTIQAYLAAHRPDRTLSFKIVVLSADAEELCERVLVQAGVSVRKADSMRFVGTAPGAVWATLLRKQGELMDSHSILLSPVRPGTTY